jgi:hypothetical protein
VTALLTALERGHLAIARLLIQRGANVNVRQKVCMQFTPLLFRSLNTYIPVVCFNEILGLPAAHCPRLVPSPSNGLLTIEALPASLVTRHTCISYCVPLGCFYFTPAARFFVWTTAGRHFPPSLSSSMPVCAKTDDETAD